MIANMRCEEEGSFGDGSLNDKTISKLQNLIQANIDSEKTLRDAARKVDDNQAAALFRDLAGEREMQARKLQQVVRAAGLDPKTTGTIRGALHQCFLDLRAAVNSGKAVVVLEEAERGEDHIQHLYRDVVADVEDSRLHAFLKKQAAAVVAGHDRVRDLRDLYRYQTS